MGVPDQNHHSAAKEAGRYKTRLAGLAAMSWSCELAAHQDGFGISEIEPAFTQGLCTLGLVPAEAKAIMYPH
jgi:hypothetical protein